MSKKKKNKKKIKRRNPVAKFARRVNRASVHRDKKKNYRRKTKNNDKLDD